MSDHETAAIQHDGSRNYFGGRNLIPDSASPVMTVGTPAGTLMAAPGSRSIGQEGMFTIMSAGEGLRSVAIIEEERGVQHDGHRNYFGGRNMIPDSASPVMTIGVIPGDDDDFEIIDIRPRSVPAVTVLTGSDIRVVYHDGQRNYFGGRNMMPGSESPAALINDSTALPRVGIAVVAITMLHEGGTVDYSRADFTILSE